MYSRSSTHGDFILTPIYSILEEAVNAMVGIGDGIEIYPLKEYVLQSIFLRMTGMQEQKLKCICWELAHRDLEYRYDLLKKPLGECSNKDDKTNVYKALTSRLYWHDFDATLTSSVQAELKRLLCTQPLHSWLATDLQLLDALNLDYIKGTTDKHLFPEKSRMYEDFTHAYRHRNRCAHNTIAVRRNKVRLEDLPHNQSCNENYVQHFIVLSVLDEIFISLYKRLEREYFPTLI